MQIFNKNRKTHTHARESVQPQDKKKDTNKEKRVLMHDALVALARVADSVEQSYSMDNVVDNMGSFFDAQSLAKLAAISNILYRNFAYIDKESFIENFLKNHIHSLIQDDGRNIEVDALSLNTVKMLANKIFASAMRMIDDDVLLNEDTKEALEKTAKSLKKGSLYQALVEYRLYPMNRQKGTFSAFRRQMKEQKRE